MTINHKESGNEPEDDNVALLILLIVFVITFVPCILLMTTRG